MSVFHPLPLRAPRAILRPMRSVLLSSLLSVILTLPASAADVLVFAAASLAGPLDTIAARFEQETGHAVTLSYAGSSALARQIEAGAPAAVVILASDDWMDRLEARGLLLPGTRVALLSNRLVLIGRAGEAAIDFENLPALIGRDRLALALTEAVPAGIYARAALDSLGQWEVLRNRIVETDNVRAALQLVAIGAAGFGIVYATDAAHEPRVAVLAQIPEGLHPPIRYPMAVTARGGSEVARDFAADLQGPFARDVFEDAGFGLVAQ